MDGFDFIIYTLLFFVIFFTVAELKGEVNDLNDRVDLLEDQYMKLKQLSHNQYDAPLIITDYEFKNGTYFADLQDVVEIPFNE